MASTEESGIAKTIANYYQLIQYCQGYGAAYAPTNPVLQVPNMLIQHGNAVAANQAVIPLKTDYVILVNQRVELFNPMPKLATRVVGALASSADVTEALIKDAKSILLKIRGGRAKKINPDSTESISVSQRSYDSLQESFSELVGLVAGVPTYSPNELDLSVINLQTFAQSLLTANQAVAAVVVPLVNARLDRVKTVYAEDKGIVTVALKAKDYVKSVFGAGSPEYKLVSGIQFKRR